MRLPSWFSISAIVRFILAPAWSSRPRSHIDRNMWRSSILNTHLASSIISLDWRKQFLASAKRRFMRWHFPSTVRDSMLSPPFSSARANASVNLPFFSSISVLIMDERERSSEEISAESSHALSICPVSRRI